MALARLFRATVSRWLAAYEAAWRAPGTGHRAPGTEHGAEVCYGQPPRQEYRDLWVIQLTGDGRCTWFEEWPSGLGSPTPLLQ